LQDATNPHLNLGSVLAADAVAVLVDGWVTGSNGNFASGYALVNMTVHPGKPRLSMFIQLT